MKYFLCFVVYLTLEVCSIISDTPCIKLGPIMAEIIGSDKGLHVFQSVS